MSKKVEVLDAELKARFGACAESNVVHKEVVEGGKIWTCEQNQTAVDEEEIVETKTRHPDSEPEPVAR